jgi:hypothetical protein
MYSFSLDPYSGQNYQNPINPTTKTQFVVSDEVSVKRVVYNGPGQRILALIKGYLNAASQPAIWNGKDDIGERVASGLYFYELHAGEQVHVEKETEKGVCFEKYAPFSHV